MKQQHTLMKYDHATGAEKPYPSHAAQWREWRGNGTGWLFNPWTGNRRSASDVGTDVIGLLIIPPGEPLYGETINVHSAELIERAFEELAQLGYMIRGSNLYPPHP